jgi:hypothetical protein
MHNISVSEQNTDIIFGMTLHLHLSNMMSNKSVVKINYNSEHSVIVTDVKCFYQERQFVCNVYNILKIAYKKGSKYH